ncbi:MAG TPA: murein transglycosylase domain-containing protein [Bacteroidota bacterium]|nr:murein transglycosylase domain-containing protein [Bacteroidota bacterium]
MTKRIYLILSSVFLLASAAFGQANMDSVMRADTAFQRYLREQSTVGNQDNASDNQDSAMQADTAFQRYLSQQNASFAQYAAHEDSLYQQYYEEQEKAFQEYVQQITKVWGQNNIDTTTKKDWVSYDPDFTGKRSVDFENGNAKVEVVMDKAAVGNPDQVRTKLKAEVLKLIKDRGTDDPMETKQNTHANDTPILTGQLQTADGKTVTESNADQFVNQLIESSKIDKEDITGTDGNKRTAIILKIPLVSDHIRRRAETFRDVIIANAGKYKMDPTLLFAVTHTESYFNPKARSGVPAYGLMQLVPTSGARAAYQFIYSVDTLVTPEYLYTPGNNVELGAGYLDLLLTKDFKRVKDDRSRVYLAISAYNTGPGNVARAFTGKKNLNQAIPIINGMTSDEVYDRLRTNLPFQETRDYVQRVSTRMGMYNSMVNGDN